MSERATEKDLWDFFAFSGEIRSIELRHNEFELAHVAYVTFAEERALDTALLLTGAVVVDRPIHVEAAPDYAEPAGASLVTQPPLQASAAAGTTPLNRAQAVMNDMLAKGYVLGKDAAARARAYDEKHQLSRAASQRVAALSASARETAAQLDRRTGLSQKITAASTSVKESARAVDEKYQVSEKSKAAYVAAGERMSEAGTALMKNKYVAAGSEWLSGVYQKVAKAAVPPADQTAAQAAPAPASVAPLEGIQVEGRADAARGGAAAPGAEKLHLPGPEGDGDGDGAPPPASQPALSLDDVAAEDLAEAKPAAASVEAKQ